MATYKTHGVCARAISFDVENNRLVNVQFAGGCSGNTRSSKNPTLRGNRVLYRWQECQRCSIFCS